MVTRPVHASVPESPSLVLLRFQVSLCCRFHRLLRRQAGEPTCAPLAMLSSRRRGAAALRLPPGAVWCCLQLSGRQDVHGEEGGGLLLQRRAAAGVCPERSAGHGGAGLTQPQASDPSSFSSQPSIRPSSPPSLGPTASLRWWTASSPA